MPCVEVKNLSFSYPVKIKNEYCEKHNINILRIPYWEKQNIESIIYNYLQRLNEKAS